MTWLVGQFVFGPLSDVFEFTLRAAEPLKTASLALHSDTGTNDDDLNTSNPLLIGTISGEGSLAGRRVEFQWGDGDGNFDDVNIVIAATAATDAQGRFRWLPTGLAYGADYDVRARVALWNASTGQYEPSDHWETLSFTLNAPQNLAPQFQSGPALADPPAAPSTPVENVTFVGRIRSERDVAGVVVEFDYDANDGDDFDEWTTTDEFGDFAFSPRLLPTGTATVRARIRETDSQGLVRYSDWEPIDSFNYQPNLPPTIDGFTHAATSGGVTLTGTVDDAQLGAGITVEFYLAGGVVLGTAETDETTGEFEFEVPGLIFGTQYQIFVRAKEPLAGGAFQYGPPAGPVSFTYLPTSSQAYVSLLQLTYDTNQGGGGTTGDGATAVAQLSGQIAGTGSLSGKTITIQKPDGSGGWTAIDTTTTDGYGDFEFTIPQPRLGYNRVRALVESANGRVLHFVYDPDDDSPQALALVADVAGPNVGGFGDIFDYYVDQAARLVGFTTIQTVQETWYHNHQGSIHCATNVIREINGKWWDTLSD